MRETARARQAWADYLALGQVRSLEKLLSLYRKRQQNDSKAAVPTLRLRTLFGWSTTLGWQQRLCEIADGESREAQQQQAAYRRSIMEEGLALDYERVKTLKAVAAKLYDELMADGRLWVQEPKALGSGENMQVVEVDRFNTAEVEQLRGILDDIAKEKGDRAKTVKIDIEARIRQVAEEAGLDPEEAVREAQRIIRAGAS